MLSSFSTSAATDGPQEGFEKIGKSAFIFAGLFAATASIMSFYSIWMHIKNYRNPGLQRLIIRILWMVPIYAISSWISLANKSIADYIETIRDMYEAFVIYSFFNLLVGYLGGERELLVNLKGRPPTTHMFPVNLVWKEMDVGNPDTFVLMRRGVLQFVILKPIFSFLTLLMKHSDYYQEGFISVSSGYVWVSLFCNISVSWSMYCLVIFFFATKEDLKPYRPIPKFICIKSIIFFSFWQGVLISVLVYMGVIRESGSYSANNIAQALQDFLICLEMVAAAYAHWYAFLHNDFMHFGGMSARMSVRYAVCDAFGLKDVLSDFRHTIRGTRFYYNSAAEYVLKQLSLQQRSRLERLLNRFGIRRKFGQSGRVVTVHGPGYYSRSKARKLDRTAKDRRRQVRCEGHSHDTMNEETSQPLGQGGSETLIYQDRGFEETDNETSSLLPVTVKRLPSYTDAERSTSSMTHMNPPTSSTQAHGLHSTPCDQDSDSFDYSDSDDSVAESLMFNDIDFTSELEQVYSTGKSLSFGDYNYPVVDEVFHFDNGGSRTESEWDYTNRRSMAPYQGLGHSSIEVGKRQTQENGIMVKDSDKMEENAIIPATFEPLPSNSRMHSKQLISPQLPLPASSSSSQSQLTQKPKNIMLIDIDDSDAGKVPT